MSADDSIAKESASRRGPTTLARVYFKALDEHDLDAAVAFWKPGGTGRVVGLVDLTVPTTYRQWFGDLFRAFPDFRLEVISITAQKERAAVRWVGRGTFDGTGKFEGLTPNGATVEIEGLDLMTIREGAIVENLAYLNGADLARQLGALPPQGSVAERGMTGVLNAKATARKLIQSLRER